MTALLKISPSYCVRFNCIFFMFLFAVLGFGQQRGGGKAAQGEHQEAELHGGASGEGAGQAAG